MGRPRKIPPVSEQLTNLENEIPALEVAIGLQEQRVDAAIKLTAKPMRELVSVVLSVAESEKLAAFREIHELLSGLAPALANLIATERFRRAIIGDHYAVPKGAPPPFGGFRFTKTLLAAFPENAKPATLSETALLKEADAIAAAKIVDIKGEPS